MMWEPFFFRFTERRDFQKRGSRASLSVPVVPGQAGGGSFQKVKTQYYSVLHSSTPVLLCTTRYYSTTTLYYKVLLRYYSVLQSATLYYKILVQLLCTTK